MAPGRQDPALRQQRPRGREGRADRSIAGTSPRRRRRPLTGPGLPRPVVVARRPVHRGDPDQRVRDRRRDPRRRDGRELLRVTNDGASLAPVWSPAGDAIAFLHLDGQIVDLQHGQARRHGARTGRSARPTALTEVSGLDGASRPDWFVPPDQLPATPAVPTRAGLTVGVAQRPVTAGYLERLAPRSAAVGIGPVPRPRPGPGRRCRRASAATSRASSAFAAAGPRGGRCRTRPPSSRTWRSSRRSARPGSPRSSGSGRRSRPTSRSIADAKRGDIGTTAARQAVALFDGLGADAVTVNPYLGDEAIAPLLERLDRFAYVLCRTSNPGAGELQDLGRRGRRWPDAPAEPPLRPGRAARGRAGGRAGRSASSSARRRPSSSRRSGRSRPGCPSSSRASAPRAATSTPCWPRGAPATAPAGGGRPGGGLLVNVSRGIAGAAPDRPMTAPRATSAERLADGRRRVGRTPPCATLAAYPPARHAFDALTQRHPTVEHCRYAEHRPLELDHHPGHRPADPRPGQAAGRRRGPRQEHPRVPQGLDRRPGRGQARHRRRRRLADAVAAGHAAAAAAAAVPPPPAPDADAVAAAQATLAAAEAPAPPRPTPPSAPSTSESTAASR